MSRMPPLRKVISSDGITAKLVCGHRVLVSRKPVKRKRCHMCQLFIPEVPDAKSGE